MKNMKMLTAAGSIAALLLSKSAFAGEMMVGVKNKTDKQSVAETEMSIESESEESTEEETFDLEESTDSEGLIVENQYFTGPAKVIYEELISPREAMGEKWSFALEDLTNDETFAYQEHVSMQSASVIKVFIMGAVYDRVCYPSSEEEKIHYAEKYGGELRSILENMIRVSNNDSANAAIRLLGGGDANAGEAVVNEFCEKYGFKDTHLGRLFLESNPQDDNYTSAEDCRAILSMIYHGELVCEDASAKMLDILKGQQYQWKLPAGLPAGYKAANKTGEMPEGYGLGCIENDIAIVYGPEGDFILTILSNELGGRNNDAQLLIQKIAGRAAKLLSE